jgi:hypothetical protein
MNEKIIRAIEGYDGKHTNSLVNASLLSPTKNDISALISALDTDKKFEEAGSWILKAWAENGYQYSENQIHSWFIKTEGLEHWGATLHFCQALESITVPKSLEPELFSFLLHKTNSDNKLVRAWSYNGLFVIAKQNNSLMPNAIKYIKKGKNDEAASVRARVRIILKNF